MLAEDSKKILEQFGGDIDKLNVHSHHGCNLKCAGCAHHSQYIHPSVGVDIDQVIQDLDVVLSKLKVRHISVLGGEPMLNVEGTRRISEYLLNRKQHFKITTNGYKIDKNTDWLIEFIKRGMVVRISSHLAPVRDKGAVKSLHKINTFAKKCIAEGIPVYDCQTRYTNQNFGWVEIINDWQSFWNHIFKYDGDRVLPHNSKAEDAYSICGQLCPQLWNGKLYKCPHTAYFQEFLEMNNQLDDPAWKEYVPYHGSDIHDDAQIEEFLTKLYEPEKICASCPGDCSDIQPHVQDENIVKRIPIKEIT